jgi:hypothetical protein
MPKIVSRKIRYANTNNITYVIERFANGSGVIKTYVKNDNTNCYNLTGIKRLNCNKKNTFVFL